MSLVSKISFLMILQIIYLVKAQNCNLPNGQQSTCVRLLHCDHFAKILRTHGGFPPENIQTNIKAHQCLQTRGTVCCPDNVKPPLNIRETTQKSITESIVDYNAVRSHRNYNLLNERRCGLTTANKVKLGWNADTQELPWQALLGYMLRNDFSGTITWGCGGALISPRYILTAAHCINRDLQVVRLGEHTISTEKDCDDFNECNDPVQDMKIERAFRHPNFDRFKKINDIALIKLTASANISRNNVKTICIPTEPGDDLTNVVENSRNPLPMTISGFGRLGNGVKESSDILQKAFLPYVKIDDCQRLYKERGATINFQGQFCAGGKNQTDTCTGDSGGPITNRGSKPRVTLFGIVLGGLDCEKLNTNPIPGVYTDIRYYLLWILDNINP